MADGVDSPSVADKGAPIPWAVVVPVGLVVAFLLFGVLPEDKSPAAQAKRAYQLCLDELKKPGGPAAAGPGALALAEGACRELKERAERAAK